MIMKHIITIFNIILSLDTIKSPIAPLIIMAIKITINMIIPSNITFRLTIFLLDAIPPIMISKNINIYFISSPPSVSSTYTTFLVIIQVFIKIEKTRYVFETFISITLLGIVIGIESLLDKNTIQSSQQSISDDDKYEL